MSDQYEQSYSYSTSYTPGDSAPKKNIFPVILLIGLGVVLLIVLIVLLFGGRTNNTNNGGSSSTEKITLQFRGAFLDEEVMQKLIDDYKVLKPNVTIEYADLWPSNISYQDAASAYQKDLNRKLSSGNFVEIPDIFMVHNTWVGDYENYVYPSTSIDAQTFKNTFYNVVSQDFAQNNTVRGVPLWLDSLAIVYNEDLVLRSGRGTVPEDWDAFQNFAINTLTEYSNNRITTAGFAGGTAKNISFGFELANILLNSNQVNVLGTDGKPSLSTNSNTLSTFQFFKNFLQGSWDENEFENDSASFLDGNTAMIAVPSYRLRELLRFNLGYDLNLKIKVAPMPYVTEDTKSNFGDYWGAMVARESRNPQAAWDFLNWLTQKEQLTKLSAEVKTKAGFFGMLSPRVDMKDDLSNDEYLKVYNSSLADIKSWYMVKGPEVKKAFVTLINKSTITQSDIVQLEAEINQLIAQKGQLSVE